MLACVLSLLSDMIAALFSIAYHHLTQGHAILIDATKPPYLEISFRGIRPPSHNLHQRRLERALAGGCLHFLFIAQLRGIHVGLLELARVALTSFPTSERRSNGPRPREVPFQLLHYQRITTKTICKE